jgi:hypothetical protein
LISLSSNFNLATLGIEITFVAAILGSIFRRAADVLIAM